MILIGRLGHLYHVKPLLQNFQPRANQFSVFWLIWQRVEKLIHLPKNALNLRNLLNLKPLAV